MKIRYKLVLSFLLVASLAGVTSIFTLQSYKEINDTFADLVNDPVQMVQALGQMKQAGMQIVSSTSELSLMHSEALRLGSSETDEEGEIRQLIVSGRGGFESALERYRTLVETVGTHKAQTLRDLTVAGRSLAYTSDEITRLDRDTMHREALIEKRKLFEEQETKFLTLVDEALEKEFKEQLASQTDVEKSVEAAGRRTIVITILTFVLAIFSGFYLSSIFARRLNRLKEASQRFGAGDLQTAIEIDKHDEIGELAETLNKMMTDLTESRSAILSAQGFTNKVIRSVANILFVLDEDLKIVRVNPTTVDTLGFPEAELIGASVGIFRPDGHFFDDRDLLELRSKGTVSSIETFLRNKDGREVPVLFSASLMRDVDGHDHGIVCVAQDITDRKSLEEQLTHQALHDPLTKLANRILFRDRVEHAINRTRRKYSPIAVLFIDLDNFKSVNDSLGHGAGDELLMAVTERLQACLRVSDTPARLGGDEFAILIEDMVDLDEATFVAERIRAVLSAPFALGGREVFIGSSIGIAITVDGQETPEDLLRNADTAMYMSKTNGKDQFTIFKYEMHDTLVTRIRLESDMRTAINKQQFELYYQPIMDLRSERVMGMEALVRWNHPEDGLIPPLDFIPLAEETGLIVPLGKWILEEACLQASKWQAQYKIGQELSITVNVASRQFQDEALLETVAQALKRSQLPPRSLILEITESTMLLNTETTIQRLIALKKLGIRFAIDDFGTGYSSLSYLQKFPVDILKIDKSFIDTLVVNKEGAAMARAIITMSDTLHLTTIAEGIETAGQWSELKELGCELGQGYHFAKPLRAADMTKFLQSSISKEDETLPIISIMANGAEHYADLM